MLVLVDVVLESAFVFVMVLVLVVDGASQRYGMATPSHARKF